MPSAQEIASKLTEITARLTAGGTNAQMKEWYNEYKKLNEELKEAKATQTRAPKTTTENSADNCSEDLPEEPLATAVTDNT